MKIEQTNDTAIGVFVWITIGVLLLWFTGIVIWNFIGAFLLAIFTYYATRPLYQTLKPYLGNGSVNAISTILTFATPFVLLVLYTGSTAIEEVRRITLQYDLQVLQPYIQPYTSVQFTELIETPESLLDEASGLEFFQGIIDYLFVVLGVIGQALIIGLIIFTTTFYLLRDDSKLRKWSETQFSVISDDFADYITIVDKNLQSIYFGNILNAFITILISVIVFSLYNIVTPQSVALVFPVLLAIFAGIFSLIPLVGTKPVYIPATGYLLAKIHLTNADPQLYIYPIGFFIVSALIVDFIPDIIIRPYVSGRDTHMGLLLIAYITGSQILGWQGFFLFPAILVIGQTYYTLIFPKIIRRLVNISD